jgi:hypothetical protein
VESERAAGQANKIKINGWGLGQKDPTRKKRAGHSTQKIMQLRPKQKAPKRKDQGRSDRGARPTKQINSGLGQEKPLGQNKKEPSGGLDPKTVYLSWAGQKNPKERARKKRELDPQNKLSGGCWAKKIRKGRTRKKLAASSTHKKT